MTRELTPEERRLIEREFAAKQDSAYRRRRFARSVFWIAIVAGVLSGVLRGFGDRGVIASVLGLVWTVGLFIYVGSHLLPTSLSKDLDPSWHLNPWQDALSNLSEGRTIGEAIALLVTPRLVAMLASFLYFAFK